MQKEINYGDCYMYPIPKMNSIIKGITDAIKNSKAIDISSAFTYASETYGGNFGIKAFYDPLSKKVSGNFYVLNATENIRVNEAFITIDAEYRPAVDTIFSLIAVSDTLFTTYQGEIRTDGSVIQSASNLVKRLLGVFEYIID